jgi:DNA-binding PadR family transcriptional regulator
MGAERARPSGTPLQSRVHWALLGLLIESPSHGYGLARRFEEAYGGMLRLSGTSYVYTALDVLQARSLIEQLSGGDESAGRQPKPRYRATTLGVRAYQERLVVQLREDCRRSRLFARQLAVMENDPDTAIEVIERCRQVCLEEAVGTRVMSRADEGGSSGLAARLVAEEGRLTTQGKMLWVSFARQQFKALVG